MRAKQWRQGVWAGVLLIIIVWLLALIWSLGEKAVVAFSQEHVVKVQYEQIEARKAALQQDISTLQTPRGQDAAVREAFGVAKPGEEVIVVVPPATPTTTPPKSWWQQVLSWF